MGYTRTGFGTVPVSTAVESTIGSGLLNAAGVAAATGVGVVAAPFLALGGAIAEMLASFGVGSGCGQTCVLSSDFANEASAKLDQNIQMYFALPIPRPASAQAAAVANVQTIFNWVQQQCGNPQLGQAGQDCISQRLDPNACHWKALPPSYPGEPAADDCWNWVNGYLYPIQNDPNVVPDAMLAVPSSSSPLSTDVLGPSSGGASESGATLSPWLLAGAAALLVWVVTR